MRTREDQTSKQLGGRVDREDRDEKSSSITSIYPVKPVDRSTNQPIRRHASRPVLEVECLPVSVRPTFVERICCVYDAYFHAYTTVRSRCLAWSRSRARELLSCYFIRLKDKMTNQWWKKEYPRAFLAIEREPQKNPWRNYRKRIEGFTFQCSGTNSIVNVFVTVRWEKRVYQWIKAPRTPARSNAMAPPDRHRSPRPGSGLSLSVLGEFTREIFKLSHLSWSLIRSRLLWMDEPRAQRPEYNLSQRCRSWFPRFFLCTGTWKLFVSRNGSSME